MPAAASVTGRLVTILVTTVRFGGDKNGQNDKKQGWVMRTLPCTCRFTTIPRGDPKSPFRLTRIDGTKEWLGCILRADETASCPLHSWVGGMLCLAFIARLSFIDRLRIRWRCRGLKPWQLMTSQLLEDHHLRGDAS
jgi:hypothetical protein